MSSRPTRASLPVRWRVTALLLVALAVAIALTGSLIAQRRIQTLIEGAARAASQSGGSLELPAEFLEQQRQAVLVHMTIYGVMTGAMVLAVVLTMWLMMRAIRREVMLAEMKSSFVADVSHELKTPLALIRMYAETLQARPDLRDEKRREYYGIIERESTRLTNLINNILDFARIDAGGRRYQLAPTDVGAVVREVYSTFREQLDREGFVHHLHVVEGLPLVDADREAIVQIMVNLINNAIKYSEEEKHIAIELTPDTRRGARGVLISVHDRGIGIQPAERAQITQGFYRAEDERVRQRTGTGLGLSLVKHIVEAHHGSLDIESRLVKGSTFRVFLPATMPPLATKR